MPSENNVAINFLRFVYQKFSGPFFRVLEVYMLFYLILFTGLRSSLADPDIRFYLGIVIGILILTILVQRLRYRDFASGIPIVENGIVYLLFVMGIGSTVLRSVDVKTSLNEYIYLLIGAFVYFGIIFYLRYDRQRWELRQSLLWFGIVFNVLKFGQVVSMIGGNSCNIKVLQLPNNTAGVVGMTMVLSFSIIMGALHHSLVKRWDWVKHNLRLPFVAFLSSFVILILSGSRQGYVATIAGLGIVLLVDWFSSKDELKTVQLDYLKTFPFKWGWGIYVVVVAVLVGAVFIVRPISCGVGGSENTAWTSSIFARFELWKTAFNVFLNYPVWGSGPGTFHIFAGPEYDWARFVVHPHSIYMKSLAETGIVGFVLSGTLLWTVVKTALEKKQMSLRMAGVGIVAFFMVQGIVDVVTAEPYVFRYMVAILAVVLSRGKMLTISSREIMRYEYYE